MFLVSDFYGTMSKCFPGQDMKHVHPCLRLIFELSSSFSSPILTPTWGWFLTYLQSFFLDFNFIFHWVKEIISLNILSEMTISQKILEKLSFRRCFIFFYK